MFKKQKQEARSVTKDISLSHLATKAYSLSLPTLRLLFPGSCTFQPSSNSTGLVLELLHEQLPYSLKLGLITRFHLFLFRANFKSATVSLTSSLSLTLQCRQRRNSSQRPNGRARPLIQTKQNLASHFQPADRLASSTSPRHYLLLSWLVPSFRA